MEIDLHTTGRTALSGLKYLLVCALLSGCSSSSSPPVESPGSQSSGEIPTALLQLQDDPGLITDIPEVVATRTMSNTGLQVAYTRAEQHETVPALGVEAQWEHMQTCLQQVAVAPIVVVRDEAVVPFTSSDDVIHNIEGIPVASASLRDVPLVQIQAADFDGSLGNPGFNLRSIMGRLLWISAGLAERDYPFQCARVSVSVN